MGPPASHGITRVPRYSSTNPAAGRFHLRACHPLWGAFPHASTTDRLCGGRSVGLPGWASNPVAATATALARRRFGLIPVRSPLLGESRLISTPRGTKMFQFPRFPPDAYGFSVRCRGMTPCALPHSGIPGSAPADGSPRLFAANHALHRLLAPRHPPCALRSAAPAPSRARHTPDLAQYVLPVSLHTYALVPVLVPELDSVLPTSSDPGALRSRRIVPPRRPTRPPCRLPGGTRGVVSYGPCLKVLDPANWRDTKTGPRPRRPAAASGPAG